MRQNGWRCAPLRPIRLPGGKLEAVDHAAGVESSRFHELQSFHHGGCDLRLARERDGAARGFEGAEHVLFGRVAQAPSGGRAARKARTGETSDSRHAPGHAATLAPRAVEDDEALSGRQVARLEHALAPREEYERVAQPVQRARIEGSLVCAEVEHARLRQESTQQAHGIAALVALGAVPHDDELEVDF